jgi:hypothetical protein
MASSVSQYGGHEMTVEEARIRLRRQLEDAFGVEEASILMDRPPGGWSDLVTNQTLDLKIDALRYELKAEMANLSASVDRRLRTQTWMMMSTMIAAVGLSVTLSHL